MQSVRRMKRPTLAPDVIDLRDDQLLALVIGERAEARAHKLLADGGGIRGIARAGDLELVRLGGLRGGQATRVAAAFEIANQGG